MPKEHIIISNFNIEDNNIKKKQMHFDTSTYEKLIFNKKTTAINLFNSLDKKILGIGKNISRNYLIKNVVYKLKRKIVEVQINQSNLLVSLYKEAKRFDNNNKLLLRKGYENTSLCYFIQIESDEDINYCINLIQKMYNYLIISKIDYIDILYKKLVFNIKLIDNSITFHNTNKGLIFKGKRNFTILIKQKNNVYIRLLNVDDKNNLLGIIKRTTYEPLCKYFKVYKDEDINFIIPYIKNSFELSKINPLDLKHDFIKLYY